jgi:hypothetical protein
MAECRVCGPAALPCRIILLEQLQSPRARAACACIIAMGCNHMVRYTNMLHALTLRRFLYELKNSPEVQAKMAAMRANANANSNANANANANGQSKGKQKAEKKNSNSNANAKANAKANEKKPKRN